MQNFTNFKEFLLKYILYFFPLFIILGNAVINFVFFIVSVLYLISCLIENKIFFKETYEFKYFLFFYIYLLANSFFSEDIMISLQRSVPYVKFFILVLIFKSLIENGKINLIKLGYIWFAIIFVLGLDIIYQSIYGYDIFNYVSINDARNSGFFFDELVAGGFLVSFVFISIFLVTIKKQNSFLYLFLFFLLVIFLTGERSNLIDYLVILLLALFFCIKINLIFKYLSLIFSFGVVIFIVLSFGNFKSRYLSTISFSQDKNLNLVETYLTSQYGSHSISSFLILKDNLLFGVGNKNFRLSCNHYKNDVVNFQERISEKRDDYANGCATHPHQIYNELLSEHGIVGLIVILFIMYKLILTNLSIKKKCNVNLVCFFYIILFFVPILPSGSFFSTLPSTFFWINYLFYIVNIKKL